MIHQDISFYRDISFAEIMRYFRSLDLFIWSLSLSLWIKLSCFFLDMSQKGQQKQAVLMLLMFCFFKKHFLTIVSHVRLYRVDIDMRFLCHSVFVLFKLWNDVHYEKRFYAPNNLYKRNDIYCFVRTEVVWGTEDDPHTTPDPVGSHASTHQRFQWWTEVRVCVFMRMMMEERWTEVSVYVCVYDACTCKQWWTEVCVLDACTCEQWWTEVCVCVCSCVHDACTCEQQCCIEELLECNMDAAVHSG